MVLIELLFGWIRGVCIPGTSQSLKNPQLRPKILFRRKVSRKMGGALGKAWHLVAEEEPISVPMSLSNDLRYLTRLLMPARAIYFENLVSRILQE